MARPGFFNVNASIGLLFALMGLATILVGAIVFGPDLALGRSGRETRADVVRKYEGGRSYNLVYEFITGEGLAVRDEDAVSKGTYKKVQEGDAIVILYDPAFPKRTRVRGDWVAEGGHLVLFILGGVFGLVGLTLLAFGVRRTTRTRRILREGTPATARITQLKHNKAYRLNGRHVFFVVRYEYEDHLHNRRDGKDSLVHERHIQNLGLTQGSEIPVRFLPYAPEQSALDYDRMQPAK
jgi:hypothetical protein